MAKLTLGDLLEISEIIEQVYQDMQDELTINIAKHIGTGQATPTGEWEIKKLSELGMLTDESIEIIAKHSKKSAEEVKRILNDVSKKSLKDVEPALHQASKKGFLNPDVVDVDSSETMQNMIKLYYDQSINKVNLTNATLLNSTVSTYQRTVSDIAQESERILNKWTGVTISAQETRREATKKAIKELCDEGLTGFVDKAGREWSPEGYVSMVIRTIARKVNIESVKTRQEEYGSDLFQVSSHGGARPLCYPYQDKIYSWSSATGGTFIDGAGKEQTYGSYINDTSQAEPAGLFQINCGHHPMPIIPGYSIVHEHAVQSPEANAKEYQESQQQRALERKIRKDKLRYEADVASGADEETLKEDKQRIRDAQQEMRNFIDETGRTRRYDREGIGSRPNKNAVF